MKKYVIAFALMVSGVFTFAQSTNFTYGISGGVGISQLQFSQIDDLPFYSNDPIVGYQVSALLDYRVGESWGISVEPGYARRGGQLGILPGMTNLNTRIKLDYVRLPILFSLYPREYVSISVGPELSYLADSNIDFLNMIASPIENKFSLGVSAGVDFHFDAPVSIGVQYNRNLTPLSSLNINEFGPFSGTKINLYNQNISLVARITI
ncbi:porin family protein [Membranihabitans maritimus]|uniref:porin family protein n=1 Tax=Membranihabitans maritimus TaxID=2904244 RepID=UPI001F44E2E3|nr:porin family protein [Membranihabitans maritimus]